MNDKQIKYEDYSLDEIAEFEQELISLEQHNGFHICEVIELERDDFDVFYEAIPSSQPCLYFPYIFKFEDK